MFSRINFKSNALTRRKGRVSAFFEEQGSTAVEFALILPLLLLLIIALIDFGRMGYVQINIISAAREGARYSALQPVGISAQDEPAFKAFVRSAAPSASTIATQNSTSSLNVSVVPCDSSLANDNTSVTVSTNFKWLIPLGLVTLVDSNATWANDFTIASTGVMRCTN